MRVVDRETAKLVAGFGSTTRANTRLLALTRAGLLKRFFVGTVGAGRKAVYTLSATGAELVNAKLGGIRRPSHRLVVSDAFVAHQEGINQVYVGIKYRHGLTSSVRLRRWISFRQQISESIKLTPDGYFEIESQQNLRPMFLEVDLGTEALSVWIQKVASYLQLAVSGEFQKRFNHPQFRVVVVANSERRLRNLRATVAKSTDKIFWLSTFDSINADGFWSPVWLRPTGEQRQSLM